MKKFQSKHSRFKSEAMNSREVRKLIKLSSSPTDIRAAVGDAAKATPNEKNKHLAALSKELLQEWFDQATPHAESYDDEYNHYYSPGGKHEIVEQVKFTVDQLKNINYDLLNTPKSQRIAIGTSSFRQREDLNGDFVYLGVATSNQSTQQIMGNPTVKQPHYKMFNKENVSLYVEFFNDRIEVKLYQIDWDADKENRRDVWVEEVINTSLKSYLLSDGRTVTVEVTEGKGLAHEPIEYNVYRIGGEDVTYTSFVDFMAAPDNIELEAQLEEQGEANHASAILFTE